MKKLVLFLCFALLTTVCRSQIFNPVKWGYSTKKIGTAEAVVYIKGVIEKGWHIYSLNQPAGGPLKTSFTFNQSTEYNLKGKMKESIPIAEFEETFKIQVFYFKDSVVFQQKIKLKKQKALIKGKITYMACTEERCTAPLEVQLSIPIK